MSSLIDRYFHWNGTSVAYPNKTISTTQSLVSWAQNQISNTFVTWIGTSGRKSLNLSNRLESNSRYSLLVFLERKPRYVIVITVKCRRLKKRQYSVFHNFIFPPLIFLETLVKIKIESHPCYPVNL